MAFFKLNRSFFVAILCVYQVTVEQILVAANNDNKNTELNFLAVGKRLQLSAAWRNSSHGKSLYMDKLRQMSSSPFSGYSWAGAAGPSTFMARPDPTILPQLGETLTGNTALGKVAKTDQNAVVTQQRQRYPRKPNARQQEAPWYLG